MTMYDTQHGTSTYDLKTGLFVTIDENGKTKILALSVLKSEDKPSFIWVFMMFAMCFGSLPRIIFTDSDPAMFWALLECWPTVYHFICIFHLWKNFFKHLRPLFVHHPTEWLVLARKFWKIAKDSDSGARETFAFEFDDLVAYVVEHTSDTPARVLVLSWLSELRQRHERWAAAWTWTKLTLGAHSTGRSEAVHLAVRTFTNKSMLLTDMFCAFIAYAELHWERTATEALRNELRLAIGGNEAMPAVVALRLLVTAHAYKILMAQGAQLATFEVDEIIDDPPVTDPKAKRYHVRRLLAADVNELIVIDDAVATAPDAAAIK